MGISHFYAGLEKDAILTLERRLVRSNIFVQGHVCSFVLLQMNKDLVSYVITHLSEQRLLEQK